jgi:CHAT domain-containing protein
MSAARLAVTLPPVLLAGEQATTQRISAGLRNAAVFHFSGHAYSDHGDPDRSALLVAPADGIGTDPFPDWTAAATRWHTIHDGWRTADIPGAGRLWERGHPAAGDLERRMERGSQPTLYARYADGQLRRLGEEWSVGDILALGQRAPCRLAFLSACSSGTAGGRSAYIDEYGGLPAALRLGGVITLVCSLWEVDEGFTALYADLFYERLSGGDPSLVDPVNTVRQTGRWLREARKPDVLRRLDRLADQVRPHSPRAAMTLEAYRFAIEARPGDIPYAAPWDWASFYAVGDATGTAGGTGEHPDARHPAQKGGEGSDA